ncbi:MAG: KilA-N domain-containing protein [Candidatus Doudnabacteria bacterium]|jgi:hypothetical protein|nr:KilA-N domain-containing protein [Candidatus Doudnabacteria bacterium]
MKTSQILNPTDAISRLQRTGDSYLNGTHLLNDYNKTATNPKRMTEFLKLAGTKEFAAYLEENEIDEKAIKSSTRGTWMHPKIFIDFAMWLSLEFKSMAIQWILDGLISARNDAGDYANQLKATIVDRYIEFNGSKPSPMIYQNEFKMLKELTGIEDRNTATEKQLRNLSTLQLLDIQLIKDKVGKASREKQLTQLASALSPDKPF